MKTRNVALICGAAFLRSMSTGTLGVVLAVYLSRNGLSATWIGAVIAADWREAALRPQHSSLPRRHWAGGVLLCFFGVWPVAESRWFSFRSPLVLVTTAFIAMLNGMEPTGRVRD